MATITILGAGVCGLLTGMLLARDGHDVVVLGCLSLPRDLFARPGFAERVMEVAGSHGHAVTPGPTREELLRLLG